MKAATFGFMGSHVRSCPHRKGIDWSLYVSVFLSLFLVTLGAAVNLFAAMVAGGIAWILGALKGYLDAEQTEDCIRGECR